MNGTVRVGGILGCAGLFLTIGLTSAASAAPQKPPSKDEGSGLPAALVKKLGLPDGCKVALPDPKGRSARVARVASRMSAWVASQAPEIKDPPKVFLHREGDKRVLLRGPAIDPVNMGVTPKLAIYQREDNLIPIGIVDHSQEVHWISISNIGELRDRISEYKDGLLDGGMLQKMSFGVRHGRIYPATIGHGPKLKEGTYTVTVLVIKLGGQVRVFGICM
ncbi:MAG: hypothetical protein HYY84_00640 [Deltaproteobacteria bacterium]|nr:hypothetical protein [Deltaproteobacteria bacterium]